VLPGLKVCLSTRPRHIDSIYVEILQKLEVNGAEEEGAGGLEKEGRKSSNDGKNVVKLIN
jgi:hypothetical protein